MQYYSNLNHKSQKPKSPKVNSFCIKIYAHFSMHILVLNNFIKHLSRKVPKIWNILHPSWFGLLCLKSSGTVITHKYQLDFQVFHLWYLLLLVCCFSLQLWIKLDQKHMYYNTLKFWTISNCFFYFLIFNYAEKDYLKRKYFLLKFYLQSSASKTPSSKSFTPTFFYLSIVYWFN